MATIIDIKIPKAIATALRIPQNNPQRQQLRVLKKLLKKARFTELGQPTAIRGYFYICKVIGNMSADYSVNNTYSHATPY